MAQWAGEKMLKYTVIQCRKVMFAMGEKSDGIGIWAKSLFFTMLVPCFPILIDVFKGAPTRDTVLITLLILTAAFAATALHDLLCVFYLCALVFFVLLDAFGDQHIGFRAASWSGYFLAGIIAIQAIERFQLHVVQGLPFPENREIMKE